MTYEYKIVDGMIDSVEQQVNILAKLGWKLSGPVQVRYTGGCGPYYTQVLTKNIKKRATGVK